MRRGLRLVARSAPGAVKVRQGTRLFVVADDDDLEAWLARDPLPSVQRRNEANLAAVGGMGLEVD